MDDMVITVNNVSYSYKTLPKKEKKFISLQELPDFKKGGMYFGKNMGGDYLIQGEDGVCVLFFDKELHEFFLRF